MKKIELSLEPLEARIAPSEIGSGLGIGNPGNNNPPRTGGALVNRGGIVTITDSVVRGNALTALASFGGSFTLADSDVSDNSGANGAGVEISFADAVITNTTFSANTATTMAATMFSLSGKA